jgi:hypothetical protein
MTETLNLLAINSEFDALHGKADRLIEKLERVSKLSKSANGVDTTIEIVDDKLVLRVIRQ